MLKFVKSRPTQASLKQYLVYYPETGQFVRNGKFVGSIDPSHGYVRVYFKGKLLYAHTLAWLYMTGEWTEVDHKNHTRQDNRFDNLRKCTRSQNLMNKAYPEGSTPGVTWLKSKGKWMARVHHKQKAVHLGVFESKDEAVAARLKAVKQLHGEFASQ